jgi:hypothetical protein
MRPVCSFKEFVLDDFVVECSDCRFKYSLLLTVPLFRIFARPNNALVANNLSRTDQDFPAPMVSRVWNQIEVVVVFVLHVRVNDLSRKCA